MLGVACLELPPHVVCQTLGVAHSGQVLASCYVSLILDREQGNGGTGKAQQVALTELQEGLVGSLLQGVVEVVAGGRGEPGRHAQIRRVSRDIHMDLVASTPELTIRARMVRRSSHVAEMVKDIPKQGWKARTVQPITTELSVNPEGGVGVVVHLSKTRKK
jgi:hypothetical protein